MIRVCGSCLGQLFFLFGGFGVFRPLPVDSKYRGEKQNKPITKHLVRWSSKGPALARPSV